MQLKILLAFLLCILIANGKLLYAFAMIRHGALYPKKDYIGNNISAQFKAQLAPAGMRQLYNLGIYLREEYIAKQNFLPKGYNHSLIQYFSSSLQRTQLSTTSLMYGMYPLGEGEKIPSKVSQSLLNPPYTPLYPKKLQTQPHDNYALNKGFQSISLHPLDEVLDSCMHYDQLVAQREQQVQKQVQTIHDEYQLLIQKVKLLFKLQPNQTTVQKIATVYRSIQSNRYLGCQLPKDYTQQDDKGLKYIYEKFNAVFQNGKYGRTLVTLIFQFMRQKLRESANKQMKKKMTFIIYHSSNMWPVMINLNLTSSKCITQKRDGALPPHTNCEVPDYGSSLIVQLHENNQNHNLFIKIKFNGKYVNVCDQRRVCPLEQFTERLKTTEQNYDKLCGPRPNKGFITTKK